MSQTLEQFAQQAIAAGIVSKDDLKAFVTALPNDRRPKDGEQLARQLVRDDKLTSFQAQQILLGKAKHLVLGNYLILDRLGQGGMGMVFKAEHRRMARQVALKVLPPKAMNSKDAIKRFQREVQAAAKLMHPNIVAAYDADESRGVHFLVMELVEGSDLATLVKAQGPLPANRVVECIIQAAKGLDYAHHQGVVHRDIKPANLLIAHDGTVKILDMGLARMESISGVQADLTGTGQIMGTVDYMAPEQAANTRHADRRSDIYGLGVTLWYLVTGRAMYSGETMMEKLLAHREQPIPSLTEACPSATAQLNAVFQRMVAKLPEDRYQTLAEAIADLERCRTGDSETPTINVGPGEDSQFSEFLKGMGTRPSGAAAAASPLATAVKPDSSVKPDAQLAVQETVKSADQAGDTDREVRAAVSIAPVKAAVKSTKKATGVSADPKSTAIDWRHPMAIAGVLAGVVGLAILCGLGVWLAVNSLTRPPGDGAGGAAQAGSGIAAGEGEFVALRLDVSKDFVELPGVAFDPGKPGTVEFWLEGRRTPQSAIPLVLRGKTSVLYFQCLDNLRLQLVVAPKLAGAGQDTASKLVIVDAVPTGRVHLAATWDGTGKYSLYVAGKSAPAARDFTWRFASFPTSSLGVRPDALAESSSNQFVTLREVRVSSLARYRGEFTPPDKLPADQNTLALYHCDEGSGTELQDTAGSNRHGKIVGATWVTVSPTLPASSEDVHRTAAEWVQSVNGSMHLLINGQNLVVAPGEPLPAVAFQLVQVDLTTTFTATKAGLLNLEPIKPLSVLHLPIAVVPDDDCTSLAKLATRDLFLRGTPQLEPLTVRFGQTLGRAPVVYLGLSSRKIEPGSLAALKDLTNLASLLLQACSVTPEELGELTQIPGLTSVNLESSNITDLHLAKLSRPGIQTLSLFGSQVTVAGLVEFRSRHPGVKFVGIDALVAQLPPETTP